MKNNFSTLLVFSVVLVLFAGCKKKTDPVTELEKAAATLATAPAVPAQPATPQPAPKANAAIDTGQQMQQAIAAYKSGELRTAVSGLHQLRATATISPEQRIALNDAMAAMMTDIYGRAAKGDAGALQAVKQYELLQTTRP